MTVVVTGNVSACKEAVEAAYAKAIKRPVAKAVIANPCDEVVRILNLSAGRMAKQNQ